MSEIFGKDISDSEFDMFIVGMPGGGCDPTMKLLEGYSKCLGNMFIGMENMTAMLQGGMQAQPPPMDSTGAPSQNSGMAMPPPRLFSPDTDFNQLCM